MKDFFRGGGGWITFTCFSGRTEGEGVSRPQQSIERD